MFDIALKIKPYSGVQAESGDIGIIISEETHCFFSLVDVLGHGAEAGVLAAIIKEYLNIHYKEDLLELMKNLHEHILRSRGAVISICRFDKETEVLEHVGIGNITVRIVGETNRQLVSRDGVVGYGTINPRKNDTKIVSGDIVLLYSDGVTAHFDVLACKELFLKNAEMISRGLIEAYSKKEDDASCLVMKY